MATPVPSAGPPTAAAPAAPRRPSPSIPVVLNEAALDSPTFRATALHFADQAESLDRWLDSYSRSAAKLAVDTLALEESINSFLSKTSPAGSPADALIDYDYTHLALKRFGEGSREWWAQVLGTARKIESLIVEPIKTFMGGELRGFLAARRTLDATQKAFDTALARYVGQSKTKEPSALREDAFAVFETRKAYLKACMEFCLLAPQLRSALDKLLVRVSFDMWREMRRSRDITFAPPSWGIEMDRVRGWAKEMEASEAVFKRELYLARRDVAENALKQFTPSRDLDDYSLSTVPFLGTRGPTRVAETSTVSEKHGWLFLKTVTGKPVRTSWVRRWYYCREGVFGWLIQGPQGVLQGDEIGVLLCNAKPAVQEERRFCFEVKTKIQNIVLQAETQAQLVEWLEVFEVAKKRAFEASLGRDNASLPGGVDPAFAITPSIPEFSAKVLENQGVLGDDGGPSFDRSGTLPIPGQDATLSTRASFDVNASLPRRALTNLVREEGETGRDHAARIIQKLDLHRKATFSTGEVGPLPSPGYGTLGGQSSQLALPLVQVSSDSRGILAPLTLARPPAPTYLSKTVVSVSGERGYGSDNSIPTVLLANYWGNGAAPASNIQKDVTGDELSESLVADAASGHKKAMSADTRVTVQQPQDRAEIFPPNYPFELRAHHAQFRILFPGIPKDEKLVLVFRASWISTSETSGNLAGNGRIYVTPDNMYLYGQHMGMAVAYTIQLDNISEVTAAPGKDCDFIFLHLNEQSQDTAYSRITIKTYLEDLYLLHTRLNLLVDDLQAEEPMETPDLIKALINVEGEDEAKKSPSTESWEEVSANTPLDDGTSHGRPVAHRGRFDQMQKVTPKFQLPTHPVVYEPDDMQRKVSERHFEISAKACFHVLFGDKSFVFPKLYFERRAQQIAQGPWVLADHGKMKREFRFKAEAVDILGRSRSADVVDFQTIELFSDHVTYVVTHVKTPWHLPHSQYFKLVTKVVITHLAKSKCKLAVYTKVNWSKTPAFSKNMVERHALADAERDAEELADVATDQVRKLGPHSRTKRAIQVYGHIGQQTEDVTFKPGETEASKKPVIKPRNLTTMMFETLRSFMESVVTSLVMWAFAGVRKLFKVVTAHRVILVLLGVSILANLLVASKDRSRWWAERQASKFMNRVGIGPNVVMSKAIYLADLGEATASNETWRVAESACYSTFQELAGMTDMDTSFQDAGASLYSSASRGTARRLRRTRQRLGSYRHDLVVAMRVVNKIEREIMQAEWENWLADESQRCEQAEQMLYGEGRPGQEHAPSLEKREALKIWHREYCGSCQAELAAVVTERRDGERGRELGSAVA